MTRPEVEYDDGWWVVADSFWGISGMV